MVAKDYKKTKGSGKPEVGEIDTSAPFQSVKDAVTLFGEAAFSGEKPIIKKTKAYSAERVLAKETQLHLSVKELNKLKDQLKNAETTKAQALLELEKAKNTVDLLNQKLKVTNESKNSGIRDIEIAREQANKFAEDSSEGSDRSKTVETQGVQYVSTIAELHAVKHELRTIRLDYDASIRARMASGKQALESENAVKEIDEISKEISSSNDSIKYMKLAIMKEKENEAKFCAEKEEQKNLHKARLEELKTKLVGLKHDSDSEKVSILENQLNEASSEIETLLNDMEVTRAMDLDSVNTVAKDLDDAKESLSKISKEESSLRSLVEALKSELECVRTEHAETKEKEADFESAAGNLHLKLLKAKSELGDSLAEEDKVRVASDELLASLTVLASETENAKQEANEMKKKAEEMKLEAEARKTELEEAESKLRVVIIEAEEAKISEAKALDQIKNLSNTERPVTSNPGTQITISRDEFDSLTRKVEQSDKLAELKVEAAIAQMEAVKASENEALKRIEAMQKQMEQMNNATKEALKKAEMAESARRAVEGELRRWREQEQRKAEEIASRIFEDTEKSSEFSSYSYKVMAQEKAMETRKLHKSKSSSVSKKAMIPRLSVVFHKKKNKLEGSSPSYLPGENPLW